MTSKKILMLSLFPTRDPDFGGQLRLVNFLRAYKKAGFEVSCVGVLGSPNYRKEDGFLSYPGDDLKEVMENVFYMDDYAIGELLVNNLKWQSQLEDCIEFVPDIIHVESPWLFKFALNYSNKVLPRPLLIYSSQNIEAPLRRSLLGNFFPKDYVEDCCQKIHEVEINAAKKADLCFCVTEKDKEKFSQWTSGKVCLAPNGVEEIIVDERREKDFQNLKLPEKYALYCASGYDPNYYGFLRVVSDGFGAMNPDQKLVITGSICSRLENSAEYQDIPNLKESTLLLGVLPMSLLGTVKHHAHCFILPIFDGGGSNLKTAEAICQGKYILGTKFSYRGYEDYLSIPGVFSTDDEADFLKTLREIMAMPKVENTKSDIDKRKELLWSNCLSDAIKEVKSLVGK